MQPLGKQQRVGAEINVFLAGHQPVHDLDDLRVHQRLAARNADDRRAAFLNRAETFLGSELFFQDVRGILDLAAAGTGQVAAQERLEHQDKGVLFPPFELLADDVGRHGPHLRYRSWYTHRVSLA